MNARKEVFDTILAKLNRPLGDYASAAAAFATDAVLARYAVVELTEERPDGDYERVELSFGEVSVIRRNRRFMDDSDEVRKLASELLRAADQLDAINGALKGARS